MRIRLTAGLVAMMLIGACGNETGSGGALDDQEAAALVQALTTAGIPVGGSAFVLSPVFGEAEIGTIGDYDGIGTQVELTTVDETGTHTVSWIGVVGWTGFDAGARTVEEAIGAMFLDVTGAFPATFAGDVADGDVITFAYDAATSSNYYPGDAGTFSMTGASFGSASDCPTVPPLGGGISITECEVRTGTMQGSVGFTAGLTTGTGDPTFTLAETAYDLPAVRVSMTVDYTGALAARGTGSE